MKYLQKTDFGNRHAPEGKSARTVGISLFPRHTAILRQREHQLNVHRSVVVQTLLELEERLGLVRKELAARFADSADPTNTNFTQRHD